MLGVVVAVIIAKQKKMVSEKCAGERGGGLQNEHDDRRIHNSTKESVIRKQLKQRISIYIR